MTTRVLDDEEPGQPRASCVGALSGCAARMTPSKCSSGDDNTRTTTVPAGSPESTERATPITDSFPQAQVMHSLCRALPAVLSSSAAVSATDLAATVAHAYPTVPEPVLRVCAAKVLRMNFDPLDEVDADRAGLDASDGAVACHFLSHAYHAVAEELAAELRIPLQ
jgi:hypothetical protein